MADDQRAFPEAGLSDLPNGSFLYPRSGVSLRDYFAIHGPEPTSEDIGTARLQQQGMDLQRNDIQLAAILRYEYADAMLEARKGANG